MSATRPLSRLALAAAGAACWSAIQTPPASARIGSAVCGAASDANRIAAVVCRAVTNPGRAVSAAKNLLTGHVGNALKGFFGGGASTASTALGLAAIVAWVVGGARFSLDETAKVLGQTTTPQLGTSWFSSRYWRIAGIAMLLTLPFLFAATVQALVHSDVALLGRAALGYLPLAVVAIAIAAPLTVLLLAATDQLAAGLSNAAGGGRSLFARGAIAGALVAEPFIRFMVALVTTACALVLWMELAIREAAVYVIVLMLPLAFAALVWPARRVWALRAVELLVALILSKVVIVAVLDLGGAALDQFASRGGGGVTAALAGTVLVLLAALSPWAVLRLVPVSELASSAVGSLRAEARAAAAQRGLDQRPAGVAGESREAAGNATSADTTNAARAAIERLTEAAAPMGENWPPPAHDPARAADRRTPDRVAAGAETASAAGADPAVDSPCPAGAGPDPLATPAAEAPGPLDHWGPVIRAPSGSWTLTLGPEGLDGPVWNYPPTEPPGGPSAGPDPLPPAQERDPLPPAQGDGEPL